MDKQAIQEKVDQIRWWHSIDLGNGIVTPGRQGPGKLSRLHFPESFAGKTVLDIGAWDGFFSFEAEKRGASRVLAVDSDKYSWKPIRGNPPRLGQAGFLLAREALDSKVEDKTMEVIDICPETVGEFDVVLFLGIFYHLLFPFYCLSRIAAVTKELLIFEGHVMDSKADHATMRFYREGWANDSTNWWYPNPVCVVEMLKTVGFSKIDFLGVNSPTSNDGGRAVFHAYT